MSDAKISELPEGGALQSTDELVVARSGSNYKIAGAAIGGSSSALFARLIIPTPTPDSGGDRTVPLVGTVPNPNPSNFGVWDMAFTGPGTWEAGGHGFPSIRMPVLPAEATGYQLVYGEFMVSNADGSEKLWLGTNDPTDLASGATVPIDPANYFIIEQFGSDLSVTTASSSGGDALAIQTAAGGQFFCSFWANIQGSLITG